MMTLVSLTGRGEVCVCVCYACVGVCVRACTNVCTYVRMYVCVRAGTQVCVIDFGRDRRMDVLVPVPGVRSAGGS